MNISCTQENLSRGIAIASRAVTHRATLPILSHILLKTEKGGLKVIATDLELAVIVNVGAKINKEGEIAVPGRLLNDFIASNRDDRIDLVSQDGKLTISSKHTTAHLNLLDSKDFPVIPEMKGKTSVKVKAKDFKGAIEQVVFASAIEETRPVLTGVYIKTDGDKLTVAATDSYRLAEKVLKLNKPAETDIEAVVPSRTLNELARLLEGSEELSLVISETQIGFAFNDITLISRVLEGSYPDYKQIIPKQHTTTVKVNSAKLQDALKLSSGFVRDVAYNITLSFKNGSQIKLNATSSHTGDVITKIDADIKGKDVKLAFNARFIIDVLTAVDSEDVLLYCSGELSPLVITPINDKNYKALIMPIKMEE